MERIDQTPAPGLVCIVGCGRRFRSDDQVGLVVAEALQQRGIPDARIIATESPCADILTCLDDTELLIVVDAAARKDGYAPGTCRRIDYGRATAQVEEKLCCHMSPHTLSVDAALTIARELRLLPPEVWIYAVSADCFEYGEKLSPAVGDAVDRLVARIRRDVEAWQGAASRSECSRHA
jgi:hydrogenase maturation protease